MAGDQSSVLRKEFVRVCLVCWLNSPLVFNTQDQRAPQQLGSGCEAMNSLK